MFKFFAGTFAIAGLIAAAGPIIIHLLNRRRFRVVEWAAMDFLRQAMQRSRRAVQLRDVLVLILRCMAVVIFGAALARPFLSGVSSWTMLVGIGTALAIFGAIATAASGILTSTSKTRGLAFGACALCVGLGALGVFSMFRDADDQGIGVHTSRQPIHAVVLIDNSMSMGYESLEGTLLDRARTKAAEFIDALPSGSQINILPRRCLSTLSTRRIGSSKLDRFWHGNNVVLIDGIVFFPGTQAERRSGRDCHRRLITDTPPSVFGIYLPSIVPPLGS